MQSKKKCYIIMPFSQSSPQHSEDYWNRHFISYLKPLVEKNENVEASRSSPVRGNIASQIIIDLINADIVLADLTDHNPNVLWELGVRQSYKHCTITIAEFGTKIPFDFSHKGVIWYNGDHLGNGEFEAKLLELVNDCIKNPKIPDSPVLEAFGERGSLYSIVHEEENNRRAKAFLTEMYLNNRLLKEIYIQCEKNQEARKNAQNIYFSLQEFPLNTRATELLLSHRYLDLEDMFYLKLWKYLLFIAGVNHHVQDWSKDQNSCEEWILGSKASTEKDTATILEYLKGLGYMTNQ